MWRNAGRFISAVLCHDRLMSLWQTIPRSKWSISIHTSPVPSARILSEPTHRRGSSIRPGAYQLRTIYPSSKDNRIGINILLTSSSIWARFDGFTIKYSYRNRLPKKRIYTQQPRFHCQYMRLNIFRMPCFLNAAIARIIPVDVIFQPIENSEDVLATLSPRFLGGNYLAVSKQLMVLFDPSRDPYLIFTWS